MNKFKTVKDYSRDPDSEVLALGKRVMLKLNGNALFPTPAPPLSELNTALNEYEVAITNAAHRGTHLIAIRKEKRAVVIDILQRLGYYVDLNGHDSESSMLETGFKVYSTENTVAPASGKPTILKGKDGPHSGDSYIKSKRMAHALTNELRYTADPFGPDATWTKLDPQSKATFLVTGLTAGHLYWFQTRTNSTKGTSDWSEPFPFMPR